LPQHLKFLPGQGMAEILIEVPIEKNFAISYYRQQAQESQSATPAKVLFLLGVREGCAKKNRNNFL
jgi:hypothetical protein